MKKCERLYQLLADDEKDNIKEFMHSYCPGDYGMKDKKGCTYYSIEDCKACWESEVEDEEH